MPNIFLTAPVWLREAYRNMGCAILQKILLPKREVWKVERSKGRKVIPVTPLEFILKSTDLDTGQTDFRTEASEEDWSVIGFEQADFEPGCNFNAKPQRGKGS